MSLSRITMDAPSYPSSEPRLLSEIIGWDVGNWGRALRLWDRELTQNWAGLRALDLGAGGGGLSLYLALRGARVTYCDFTEPRSEALALFERHGQVGKIEFSRANVTRLPFRDASYDLVAFKSLLASVGKFGGFPSQKSVLDEAYRVLKPGGLLLFAENARGSALHAFCRDRFVAWGHDCRYPSLEELNGFLSSYSGVRLVSFGVLAAFGRREWQRRVLSRVDRVLTPVIPKESRYLAYGYAVK
jgi:ubiquinone/menaquinone biosynthesis C-methylase UbiE